MKINYAKDIKVVLKSSEGRVKFSTEPEPNGFFIIPVYEKAQYTLSVQVQYLLFGTSSIN